jgi:c-di-GMP-binding flagellar brake protein YcgR
MSDEQADVLAPYRVDDGLEVVALLKRLCSERALVTLYAGVGGQFLVTTILRVDVAHNQVVFDFTTDEARRQMLLGAARATAVGYLDSVKIQFDLNLKKADPAATTELKCPVPAEMFRIQRRNAYRARPLASQPATCWIANAEAPGQREPMRLLDISLGGVALMAVSAALEIQPGMRLEHCVIELPGHDRFACDMVVRYLDQGARALTDKQRCGCEFLGLSGSVLRLIQVYVNEVEQRRRAQSR